VPSVTLRRRTYTYDVQRSPRRRRFALSLSAAGALVAHVPAAATDAEVAAFVQAHAETLISRTHTPPPPRISLHSVRDHAGLIRFRLVRRPRRRRATIMVLPDGEVEVRAPVSAPVAEVERFVHEQADWIRAHVARVQAIQQPARRWVTGETLLVAGSEVALRVETRLLGDDEASLRGRTLTVSVGPAPSAQALADRVRDVILAWLSDRLCARCDARLPHWAARLGVDYRKVTVKDMKTRWGSCSARGTLSLSLRLAMAPPEVVDYVLVHELAHRRQLNHSAAFWALVEAHLPDHRKCREWLKHNERRMRF
jgi:predicted metal-dependent hydrolase